MARFLYAHSAWGRTARSSEPKGYCSSCGASRCSCHSSCSSSYRASCCSRCACSARYFSIAARISSKRRFLSLSLRRKAFSSILRELARTLCATEATSALCLWSSASSGSTTCVERCASSKTSLLIKADVLGVTCARQGRRRNSGATGAGQTSTPSCTSCSAEGIRWESPTTFNLRAYYWHLVICLFECAGSGHIQSTKAASRLFDLDDIAAIIERELKSFAHISAFVINQRDNTTRFTCVRSVIGLQMKFNFIAFQFDNFQSGAFPL